MNSRECVALPRRRAAAAWPSACCCRRVDARPTRRSRCTQPPGRGATIQSYFAPRAGGTGRRAARRKAVDAGLKALYASGLFTDAKVARADDRLIVTVVEAPVIDRIAFEGNHSLKDKDLQGETQSKVRGALIAATVQADVMRLTELYRHAGRFDAHVVPKTVAPGATAST
jgi:outer membrane protein insertion porin family